MEIVGLNADFSGFMARFLFVKLAVILQKKKNIISIAYAKWTNIGEEECIIPAKTIRL